MLPVFGQAPPEPETTHEETGACSDDCCSESTADTPPLAPLTPRTREANPQAHEGRISRGGLARTVVRVEGRDCASCAATVEKRVGRLPGMHRAVVNFAAGRPDAEHERGLELQEIEKAVRDAGYGVGSAQEVERTPEPSIAA
jgi:Zn2+/Cd2+-exporting ATPase